jgi:glyoxylase-like metal-dependent hydrolase (beta-lactamase superfamily II)
MTNAVQTPYQPGVLTDLGPNLAVVLAPNPSPMTFWGTNTYLIGNARLAIIDPGPDDPAHLAALLRAIDGREVTHILLTHSHLDHSPLARPLAEAIDASIYAFGDSSAGRSPVMSTLAAQGLAGGGEGIDHDFCPDVCLTDGAYVTGDWGQIQAVHTPGHIGNHLCFVWGDRVFTGDHVMDWASSLVSPPDGDLTDFMQSCAKLSKIPADRYYPGHGALIARPAARLDWLIKHRKTRESGICKVLEAGPATVTSLTNTVYADVAPALLPAAKRNVFAHLVDLHERHIVRANPSLSETAEYQLNKA